MSFSRYIDPALRSRSHPPLPPLPQHVNQNVNPIPNSSMDPGTISSSYDFYMNQTEGAYFDHGPFRPLSYQSYVGTEWRSYYQEGTYQSTSSHIQGQLNTPHQCSSTCQPYQCYQEGPQLPLPPKLTGPHPPQPTWRQEEASSNSSSSLRDFIQGRCSYQDVSPQSSTSPTPPSSEEAEKTDEKGCNSDSSSDSRKRKRETSSGSSSGKDQKSERGSSGSEREMITTESQLPSPPNSVKSDEFMTDRQIETRRLINETSRRLSDSMIFTPLEKPPVTGGDQQGSERGRSEIPRPILVRCITRGRSSPGPEMKGQLRPVIIDGSNVAFAYGEGVRFACQGIRICVDHFIKLGCQQINVVVSQQRLHQGPVVDGHILEQLRIEGRLVSSWSRRLKGNRWISSYDDRLMLEIASKKADIVISNDHFRDLWRENPCWRYTISHRVVGFCFVPGLPNDIFFPKDPYGNNRLLLDRIIRFD